MSDPKITLLVLGAGCAAMIGVAAAVVSTGSFFSDLNPTNAQAASLKLPPHKVKTVAIVDKLAQKGAAVTAEADASHTASVKTAIKEKQELHGASPRWARSTSGGSTQSQRDALLAAYSDDNDSAPATDTNSFAAADPGDPFAMIVAPEENAEPTVELAGTVPHLPAPAPRSVLKKTENDDRPAPKPATTGRALTDTTTINEAANMRAAPRSGSAVLLVVPDGARVSAAPGCEQWCEIAYNGRRGFVYKDFLGAGSASAKPRAAKVDTVSADPIDKTIYGDSNFITSGKQSTRPAEKAETEEKTAATTNTAKVKKPAFEPSSR